jgi:hypothetical protein
MRWVWPLLLAVTSAPARAEAPVDAPTATEVDRDTTPPGGGELGFDAGTPLDTWSAALATSFIERPFGTAVRRRESLVVGGALALGPSVVVDARFPLSHQVGDRLRALGSSVTRLDRFVPGDLRIGVRLHVSRPVFLRGELSLPTGDAHDFAGESSWMAAWGLIGRFELPAGIVLAATGGIRLRGDEVLLGADRVIGNELFGAAGIIGRVRPELALTAEVAACLGDEVQGVQGPYPAEARAGVVVWPLPFLELSLRGGVGLNDEIGAPRYRVMLQVAYRGPNTLIEPAPPPPDDEITAQQ